MLVHAAALSSQGASRDTYVVALEGSRIELEALVCRLQQHAIAHVLFREPDPPYLGELMSVGVLPVSDRRIVRRHLKGLRLFGGSYGLERRPRISPEDC